MLCQGCCTTYKTHVYLLLAVFHNLDMMMFTSPQDKLVSRSQLDLVTSDPGRLLAWLVLLSTLVTRDHI